MPLPFARIGLAIAFALAAQGSAFAASLSADEEVKVRSVIVAQLAAFAEDDADKAFATATPAVREAIGNSGRFLAMVRGTYPMVYRPSAVTFLKPEGENGAAVQLVEITDGDAKSWLAMFVLEQQPDATWRINSCAVTENRWPST